MKQIFLAVVFPFFRSLVAVNRCLRSWSCILVVVLGSSISFANSGATSQPTENKEFLQNTSSQSLQPKHGGELQPGKSLALEFKQDGELIQFFPQSADGNAIETKDFKISGLIKVKKGKPQKLIFAERDGYYFASLDFGDAVQLNLEVRLDHSGTQERFQLVAKNPKSSKN